MATLYNAIQGRSLDRLSALSDGIFAVAMMLLVLDFHAPAVAAIHSESDLLRALGAIAPEWVAYLMSSYAFGALLCVVNPYLSIGSSCLCN